MRVFSFAILLLLPLSLFAQSRYSYVECADKYRTRYHAADDLDKFCYSRIACSAEKGMGRAGCSAALNKNDKLFACVQAKKAVCTTGLCLEDTIYSCAHRCPEGSTIAGNRCSTGAGMLPIVFEDSAAHTAPSSAPASETIPSRAPASTGN